MRTEITDDGVMVSRGTIMGQVMYVGIVDPDQPLFGPYILWKIPLLSVKRIDVPKGRKRYECPYKCLHPESIL